MLELLLRCTRDDAGHVGFQRGTKWLARETRRSTRTVEYARRRLVDLGYLEIVRRGDGEFSSLYRVVLERLRAVDEPAGSEGSAVHPGEKPAPVATVATRNGCDPEPQRLRPGAATVATPTRARANSLELPRTTPLTPHGFAAGGTGSTTSKSHQCPAAWRRGEPCENCRACGTTKRQLAKAAAEAAKASRAAPHCGRCDPASRLEELDDGTLRRCPVCHPLRDEVAAVAGDDLVDRWAYEHTSDVDATAENPNQRRETG